MATVVKCFAIGRASGGDKRCQVPLNFYKISKDNNFSV